MHVQKQKKLRWRLAVSALALIFLVSLAWSQITDSLDTVELLVRNTPQLGWAVRLLPPGPPVVRSIAATPGDRREQGALYVPNGGGRYPAVVILPGIARRGWQNPQVITLSESLAGLGLTVYVPDLPGLKNDRLTTKALVALEQDLNWLSESRYVDPRHISLLGVCAGASLAILTTEDKDASPLVHAVIALDPYARMRDLVEAATTGQAPGPNGTFQPFAMDPWSVWALADSTVDTIRDPASRALVIQMIGPESSADPLASFRATAPPGNLSPAGLAWWRLWANRSPAGFAGLYQALPQDVQDELSALSPGDRIAEAAAPVLIIDPSLDTTYPPGEGEQLAQGNSRMVQLTVTSLMNHVTPDLSRASALDLWKLVRFAYQTAATLK